MSRPDQIRAAVLAGDFPGAAELFEQHVRALCDSMQAGACDPAAFAECRELFDRCRQIALAFRAHTLDRLREIETRSYVAGAYR